MGVGFFDEAVDGVLKVGDGSKHAAFEAPICELGEEAFDGIEQCAVQVPAEQTSLVPGYDEQTARCQSTGSTMMPPPSCSPSTSSDRL
jgi:hypothetical protein